MTTENPGATHQRSGPSLCRLWQGRVLDGAVAFFALFTLASHATVAVGGTLHTLEAGFAVLLVVSVGLYFFLRRALPDATPDSVFTESPVATVTRRQALRRLRLVGIVVGLASVGVLSQTTSGELIWWWVAVPLVLAAGAFLWIEDPGRDAVQAFDLEAPVAGPFRDAMPWVLSVLAVVLTLVAHRPDTDDAFYVNLAVSAIDLPDRPILTGDTMHGIAGLPLHLPLYKLHSWEMLWATVAEWTGLSATASFHFFAASVGAFLLPLASARLFRLLTPRTWPWTLVFFLVVLVAVGEPHRWYGNFAFVRLWQGKGVFLFVALPLIYSSAIRFTRLPSRRSWLALVAVQIAALGLTSTALTHAPIAVMATIGAMVATLRPCRDTLIRLVGGAASCAYLVAAGLLLREATLVVVPSALRSTELTSEGRLWEALAGTLGTGDLHLVALAALLLAWALTSSKMARRFALFVPLFVWLMVLSPFVETLTVRFISGGLYWRTLWMVPLPLLITLGLTWPVEASRHRRFLGGLSSLGLLAAFTFFVPGSHGLSAANRVRLLPVPELKIHTATYRWALELQAETGAGVHVVAPEAVGDWIPTFHHHAYPLVVGHYLRIQRRHLSVEEWRQRDLMTRYVDGSVARRTARAEWEKDLDVTEVFRQGLERFEVQGVCLRVARNDHVEAAREVLRTAGFTRGKNGSDFEVWTR